MDIASLITSFATGTYTITRRARGSTVRGRVEAGTESTLTITGSASPASGADIEKAAQGRLVHQAYTVFTTTPLKIGGIGDAFEADIITINGSQYELRHLETWQHSTTGNVGYKAIFTDMT